VTARLVQDATRRDRSPQTSTNETRWTCAFVNNMPDGAFDATERQYLELLDAGSGFEVIDVRRYAMDVVARGERTAARIAEEYSPVFDVYLDPPDVLIVTASKPIETKMRDELYWADLAELLSWGSENVASMLVSCLSAHAAMTIFDGIERVRLASKCTGVFAQQVDRTHPLTFEFEPEILLPHTRNNTVTLDALVHSGYRIAIHSDEIGWSVATKEIGGCNVVFVQSHPEYEPSSCCASIIATLAATFCTSATICPSCRFTVWRPRTGRNWRNCTNRSSGADEIQRSSTSTRSMTSASALRGPGAPWPSAFTRTGWLALRGGGMSSMRDETITIQVESDRPVALAIYQSVAYDFIDAKHDQLPTGCSVVRKRAFGEKS
jgi:homoserine O-succinyltransferase